MNTILPITALAMLCMSATSLASRASDCGKDKVTALELLGSGHHTHPGTTGGYLLWHQGKARILLNAGPNPAISVYRSVSLATELDAIVFTRLTAEATSGLPYLVSRARHLRRKEPLLIYGPAESKFMPSTVSLVRGLFDSKRGSYRYLGEVLSPLGNQSFKLRAFDVSSKRKKSLARKDRTEDGVVTVYQKQGIMLKAVDTGNNLYPSLAWQITAGNRGIVMIDAPATDNRAIENLARNTAVLVTRIGQAGAGGSLTASHAGSLAYRTESGQLLIAYHDPASGEEQAGHMSIIKSKYAGMAAIAQPGACISLMKNR